MIMIFIVIAVVAVVAVILYFVIRPYFLKYDNIVCFTGAIGSGKTLNATDTAIRLLKRQRSSVRMYNLFHRKHKRPLPMLYSNIPLRIGFREMSLQLTEEHLLMQRHIVPRSIVFIDEVGQFVHPLEYKNPNLVRAFDGRVGAFDEFCRRLFRHYTFGGYLVMTTQSIGNDEYLIPLNDGELPPKEEEQKPEVDPSTPGSGEEETETEIDPSTSESGEEDFENALASIKGGA